MTAIISTELLKTIKDVLVDATHELSDVIERGASDKTEELVERIDSLLLDDLHLYSAPEEAKTVSASWVLSRINILTDIGATLRREYEILQDAGVNDFILKLVCGAEGEISVACIHLGLLEVIVKGES